MAATTEKRAGDSMFAGIGRNIFRSDHRCLSPMSQLKNWDLNSVVLEQPSTDTDGPKQDDIKAGACLLARDYIDYKARGSSSSPKNEAARTLRRVGDELTGRHTAVVNAVAVRLRHSDPAGQRAHETLSERAFLLIADEISKDKQDNWGRVVSLFVLGAILAGNNMEKGGGQDIEKIIGFVGDYVGTHKRSWIERNGGWDGFVRFFKNDAADEKTVLKGLLCAGLGLGAIMAVTRQ